MRLVVLAGFLGAGKTTVALQLARAAQAAGRRVALIINERGLTGIDNQLAARLGFDVSELLGGCICCTLGAELAPAVESMVASSDPDIVIVEPSGVAEPAQIRSALRYARIPGMSVASVSVVDGQRIRELMPVIAPLVHKQIAGADMAIIGKADIATPAEIDAAREIVLETSPRTDVYCINARAEMDSTLIRYLLN